MFQVIQKLKLEIVPNPHQKEFLDDVFTKLLHLSTGFGGGKTHVLCYKLLQLSYLNRPYPGGLIVPDFAEYRKDVLPEFESILEKSNIDYRYHQTEHWFKFPWSNGRLYVVSAEKKLRGPSWAYAGINEVTLILLVRYKEVLGRVRLKGARCPQIVSVGTPEGFASEYYDYFFEKPPKNFRVIFGSTEDNRHNLHDDYLDLLGDAYDKKMQDAYLRGLWVNMNGSPFYYSHNPVKNWDKNLKPDLGDQYHIGMDFNVDPFCASIWLYDGFSIYGVGQIKLDGNEGYSTENMISAMKARGYHPHNSIIYPDPAGKSRSTKGPSDVKILESHGYTCRVRNAAPHFRRRQLNVNNLLDKGRIKYNPDLMPDVKKDFEGVEFDVVTFEKTKTNKNLTHFSDGVDYLCDILFPFSGDLKSVTVQKYR